MIFSPIHFGGVSREIRPSDVMMNADLRAAEAREKAFNLICRDAVQI